MINYEVLLDDLGLSEEEFLKMIYDMTGEMYDSIEDVPEELSHQYLKELLNKE